VKRPFIFLLLIVACGACNVSERPITDPSEMVEKAEGLVAERSLGPARTLFEQALKLLGTQTNPPLRLRALRSLSSILLQQREFRASFDRTEEGLALSKSLGDFHAQIDLAIRTGDVFSTLREYNRATEAYDNAMVLAASFGDDSSAAEAERKLAVSMNASGESEKALDHALNVVTMLQKLPDAAKLGEALFNLGDIYRAGARYSEALNSLSQALGAVSRFSDPALTARIDLAIGRTQLALDNPNAALTSFRDAANAAHRARGMQGLEALSLFRIGSVYLSNGRVGDAKKYFTDALEVVRGEGDLIAENYLYIFIVDCNVRLMTQEQRTKTEEKLEQSYLQIARRFEDCGHATGEAYMDVRLGRFHESHGDIAGAIEMYQKAIDIDRNTLAEYLDDETHRPYQEALGINEAHEEWYDLLAGALVSLGRNAEALETLESGRTRRIFTLLENVDLALQNPRWKKQVGDLRSAIWKAEVLQTEVSAALSQPLSPSESARVMEMKKALEDMKHDITGASRVIAAGFPNYAPLLFGAPEDLAGAQRLIPAGSLLVEFLPLPDRLVIFGLTRSGLVVRSSPVTRDTLLNAVAEYRLLLQDRVVYAGETGAAALPAMERFAQLASQLYEWFFRPVDDLLDRNLIIVMNQEFGALPFHTLERQSRNGTVQYLIEVCGVDYLTTLSSLKYRGVSPSRIRDVVAFGNPTGKNWSIDYELRDLRSFFKGAMIYVGLESSWDNVRSARGDVLQLSTEFSEGGSGSPLGEIVLSNGITVEESSAIPFEKLTELEPFPVVVLSNQYGRGVGLSGDHAWLLRMNGTADVFLNAWFADRKSAKFFSEYFYTSLANGLAPGDAYRQALLNLIGDQDLRHPHSWGQFFHFGVG